MLKLLEEFRSERFKSDNDFVCGELGKRYSGVALLDLPADVRARVLSVMHFYDHLALLVKAGIVRQKYVVAFMGEPICRTWLALEPFIESRRAGGKDYQAFFEDLAVRATHPSQTAVLRSLRLTRFSEHQRLRAAIERDLASIKSMA